MIKKLKTMLLRKVPVSRKLDILKAVYWLGYFVGYARAKVSTWQ
jgi:hypothetical protein